MALFTNPLGRAASTYLGPMTWAALQASAYANGSVGLAALSADASVFITDWRVAMVPSADKTYWDCPHKFALDNFSATNAAVVYAATGTSASAVASSNAGATTRVTHTGHGLTAANNGVSVYVSAGTNWAVGLYPFTYVDANNYDLAVAWNASFGTPTVRVATGASLKTTLRSITIPAGLMQNNSELTCESEWKFTQSANYKYVVTEFGGTVILTATTLSYDGWFDARRTRNCGVKNAQVSPDASLNGIGVTTVRDTSVNTANANTWAYIADPRAVNEFVRLCGATLLLKI